MRLTVVACNYFKKYVQREIAKATGVTVRKPFQGFRDIRKKKWYYDENRPWTSAAKETNISLRRPPHVVVQPISKKDWTLFKGDRVEILVGRDKGKQGLVNSIIKERNWCFVEGLNCSYRWLNKSAASPGTLVKEEKPLLVTTEVALIDPADDKATDIEWRYTEEGIRVRVSTRTGRVIPLSKTAEDESYDMVQISSYVETDKDTKDKELKKITFKPRLSTFEQDIMEKMGIKEDREPAKTYWY
ncbi:probable 39S ribosomal protein L24, mitochondrial [Haliotis rufescens]|uniref:probable 39S ribosomal protein L24, mitochondrial n=1 Tax=Haliotis rufescens TaxID=6454 RepID=UPI00201F82D7|nr:probable 39S ribosomal protein L24, mitochondrial [Haliotis rufescens]